jgi:hypothetical protein
MLRLALRILIVRYRRFMLRPLHYTGCHSLVWNKSCSIIAELVVLKLVHEILLISSLHCAWTWVHNFLSNLILSILTWWKHLDIVTVAPFATKTCQLVVRDFWDIVLFSRSWIFSWFSKLVRLFNLTALRKNWIIIGMLDLFFIAAPKILYFWFWRNRTVRKYLCVFLAYCNLINFGLWLVSCYRTLSAWLWLASCCFQWPIQVTTCI